MTMVMESRMNTPDDKLWQSMRFDHKIIFLNLDGCFLQKERYAIPNTWYADMSDNDANTAGATQTSRGIEAMHGCGSL